MAGLYLHIPFCKQACNYCDFHFSTSRQRQGEMVEALIKELELRQEYVQGEKLGSIYFGGGTPSVLSEAELDQLFSAIHRLFSLEENPEITLEANPDDLTPERIQVLANSPVNRLSIGIQSFREEDLKTMNRAHNATEAHECLSACRAAGFDDLSLDLMYGLPGLSTTDWLNNLQDALQYQPEHISAYCLTVEPGTVLAHQVTKGTVTPANEKEANTQMQQLMATLEEQGYEHYEISNFARAGRYARHNTAYWQGKTYLGVGPSAHSYNGGERQWNVANNPQYLKSLSENNIPAEVETLTKQDRLNETVLLSLRTMWGLDLSHIRHEFGKDAESYLRKEAEFYLNKGQLREAENRFFVTPQGKPLADRIASDLFALEDHPE